MTGGLEAVEEVEESWRTLRRWGGPLVAMVEVLMEMCLKEEKELGKWAAAAVEGGATPPAEEVMGTSRELSIL